jgi:hypothetical protein
MAQSYTSTKNGCLSVPGLVAIPGSFRIMFTTAQNQVIEMCGGDYVNRIEGFKDITFSGLLYVQKGTNDTAVNIDGERGTLTATIDVNGTNTCAISFDAVVESSTLIKDEGQVVTLEVTGGKYGSGSTDVLVPWITA